MRFDRESYRKLYVSESAEHRLLPLFARGLRDYLLRFAMEDGTLLPKSSKPADDLARVLGAGGAERRSVAHAVSDLIGVGYLSYEGGRLWITRYVEAQEARTPGALRQQRYRDTHPRVTRNASSDADGDVTSNVTSNRRDETRREIADGGSAQARATPPPPAVVLESAEQEPRLTTCPLNLLEKAEEAGIVRDFVEKYRVEPDQIRDGIREFIAHWTIGGGVGRKEANWFKKLRGDLKFKCETPGKLKAIGELEHQQTKPKRGRGGAPTALVEVMPAPYHDAWKPPDWMKSVKP